MLATRFTFGLLTVSILGMGQNAERAGQEDSRLSRDLGREESSDVDVIVSYKSEARGKLSGLA